jgi:hypothetical protein
MHFVLDQNFPWHSIGVRWPASLQISQLASIEPHLTAGYEDWEVIRALAQRGDVDGFVTNDAKMLNQSTEMVVLFRSRLVLVVTDGVGHDPIRATGLVMVHLSEITKRVDGKPQVYVLRPGALHMVSPGQQVNKIAEQRRIQPNHLISEELKKIAGHGADSAVDGPL